MLEQNQIAPKIRESVGKKVHDQTNHCLVRDHVTKICKILLVRVPTHPAFMPGATRKSCTGTEANLAKIPPKI